MKISDVAKKCGVAPSTVSKVINEYNYVKDETRQRVLKTIDEMGYQPNATASTLKSHKSWIIGVIYDEYDTGLLHPLFTNILDSFKTVMEENGYTLMYLTHKLHNVYRTYLQHCEYRNVDAVIISTSVLKQEEDTINEIKKLLASGVPCVSIDHMEEGLYSVVSDNFKGGYNATKYLIEQGHTKIVHVNASTGLYTGKGRYDGYKKALEEAGIPFNEDYVIEADFFVEEGQRVADIIAQLETQPTAIFAAGDEIAYGIILRLQELGKKIPDDISIVGFDDIYMSKWFHGGLTTVRQQQDVIGRRAAQILLQKINGKAREGNIEYIDTPIVVRKTVKSISNKRECD